MHKEFLPSTRQRSLALAQALATYPTLGKDKSSLECILAFEQMVQQFEEASESSYPIQLKSATLIRCCHAKVREYLQLTVTDSTTYADIREAISSHDRAGKVWSQETVMRSLTQGQVEHRTDGPLPMEVDRSEKGKGKDKGKYKGKSKGREWSTAWGYLRGKGRGCGFKGKGKDEGKGKGKHKGKSKSKNKGKNKGKGKLGQNQCSECLQYGHWARDCPNEMRVNQVEQNDQGRQQPPDQGAQSQMEFPGGQRGACGSSTAASSSNSTVRRVFNIGMPNLSSTASVASSSVRVIFEEIIENNVVNNFNEQDEDHMEEELVIVDSGSDVSLLPKRHQRNLDETTLGCKLQNCQGGALEISGTKHAELYVQDQEGQGVILQHKIIVGYVQSCIMSLGELYLAGWHIDKQGDDLSLLPPDDSIRVPVFYKKKSLAIRAHLRCVQEVQPQEEEADVVRAITQLNENFNLDRLNMWQTTTDGAPYLLTKRSRFADPRPVFGGLWNYRSTFYRKVGEGRWYIAEIGNKFMDMEEPFLTTPEIAADLSDVDILKEMSP